jgi:hypothetical protein
MLITNSCHKFKEDPFLSLKSPQKRLRGTWKILSYKINGVDHTHDFDSLLVWTTLTNCSMIFNNNRGEGSCAIVDEKGLEPGKARSYSFQFDNYQHARKINVSVYLDHFSFFFWKGVQINAGNAKCTWEITELYSKDMHLSNNGADIYLRKQ